MKGYTIPKTDSAPPKNRSEKIMRLLIVPFILVAMLVQTPAHAQGNSNQEAAEKIASTINKNFPDADIDVAYKGGQVWLKGEAGSLEQRQKIVEQVHNIPGVNVADLNDEIRVVAPKTAVGIPPQSPDRAAQTPTPAVVAPVPMPNQQAGVPAPIVATNVRQTRREQAQQLAQQQAQFQQGSQPQTMLGALMAPAPQQHYPAAYGLRPGQPSAVPAPYAPAPYPMPVQTMQQPAPQYAGHHQPAYYGPPPQAAYHPEAYGPQGPLPGQYNQPHLPDYAWPTYANYPNYAQVSYPRAYSPKAWPYIGPFYPYPQAPLGWRKVTLEHSNGNWWLDFDDGTPSGPFSGLFRQPMQYTY